ncbi:helix-turn-helix transcriptional regulator [Paracoccus niistensis]|uniref:Helix-turn-helix transcriptional regulator n=1 Tax=Paracoccus niistensis TaxID=632935 RepID=A0ABV6I5I8_9RHOB
MERCVSALYEAALSPEHWHEVVQEISDFLDCGATIVHAPVDNFSSGQLWMKDVDPEVYLKAPPELLMPEHNPGIRAAIQSPGLMIDRKQFIPDAALPGHPVAVQFFDPNGIEHLMIGLTQADHEVGSLFVLSRRRNQFDFDARERKAVDLLADHVGRAMRMHRALRMAEAQVSAFGMAIENLNQAVFLVDRDLRILHANRRGEAMLEEWSGLARWHHHLVLSDPNAQKQLEAGVKELTSRFPPTIDVQVMASRRSSPHKLRITAQLAMGDGIAALSPRSRVLLFVEEPGRTAEPRPEDLIRVFGMTAAEAKVAVLAAKPLKVSEIATRLQVSKNTVKTQMKAIYQKTGSPTRAHFLRALQACEPVLNLHNW